MADVLAALSSPYLQGIFAPVHDETDVSGLAVVQGKVPVDLAGTYLRNGPNPRFAPIGSYTFPIDGDGMVHGVWFADGVVRYRNRFVETPALRAEERLGRAVWPGLMTFDPPPASLVGDTLGATIKDLPDINVVRHGGRILALAEGNRPFELTPDLATVGPWTFDGALPKGLCAHPKVDPLTGELIVFRYDFVEPFLTWAVVGADGTVTRPETPVEIDGTYMIHDCAITADHLVVFVCPFRFDLAAAMRGEPVLAWEPDRGTRIAVIPRDGSDVTWFEVDTFWVWHVANAFADTSDDGVTITVDFCRWDRPVLGGGDTDPAGSVQRVRLDLDRRAADLTAIDDRIAEFPRVDDRVVGRRHRYLYTAAVDGPEPPTPGTWNALQRFDIETGRHDVRRGHRVCFGEPVFAPRANGSGEDDGYVLSYAYDTATLDTTLLVLDAGAIATEPVATIRMPQRVPFGLHGTFMPAAPP